MGIAAMVNNHPSCVKNDIFCLANQKFEWIWPNNIAAIQQIAEKTLTFTEARFATCPHLLQPLQHDINKELKAVDQLKMTYERLKNQFGIKDAEEEGQWFTQKQWESFNQIMQTIEKLPYFGKEDFNRMFEAVPIDGPKNTNQVKKAFQQEIVRRWQQQWRNASERLTMLKKDQETISGSCTKIDQLHQHYTSLADLFTSCSPNFSDCILNDSGKRRKALDMMASAITEILPKTAKESKKISIRDCLSLTQCSDIDENTVHKREKEACNVMDSRESIERWFKSWIVSPEWKDIQEFLRFRTDDPREKLLYLVAEYDHNNALKPESAGHILSPLSYKYDIKYRVVSSSKEICEEIARAQKTGKLAHVFIDGHGTPDGIAIGKYDYFDASINFKKCFSGVHPGGKIVLFSCSTGGKNPKTGDPWDNIAQKIADSAKRTVVAPKDTVFNSKTSLLSEDTAMLFQPDLTIDTTRPIYNKNSFRLFKPNYPNCSGHDFLSQFIDSHPIWKNNGQGALAAEEIQKNLLSKSLVSEVELKEINASKQGVVQKDRHIINSVNGQHLAFCKEDPREKLLYLVSDTDKNGALNPQTESELLGACADTFDFKYSVIHSMREICSEINDALNYGDLVAVVIDAHGSPSEGMMLGKESDGKQNILDARTPEISCFSKVKKGGVILLSGGSTGQDGLNANNLAQKIADISKRTVLAPTCPIYSNLVSVKSLNPLILKHPSYSWMGSKWYGCPENGENLFKTFEPK